MVRYSQAKTDKTDKACYPECSDILHVNDLVSDFVRAFYLSRYITSPNINTIVVLPKTDEALKKEIKAIDKALAKVPEMEKFKWLKENDNYAHHCIFDRAVECNGVKNFDKTTFSGVICRKNKADEILYFKSEGCKLTMGTSIDDISTKCDVLAKCCYGLFVCRGEIPKAKPVKTTAIKALTKLVNGRNCKGGAAKYLINCEADDISNDYIYSAIKHALQHPDDEVTIDMSTPYDQDIENLDDCIDGCDNPVMPTINPNMVMTGGKTVNIAKTVRRGKKVRIARACDCTDPKLVNMLADITTSMVKDGIDTARAIDFATKYVNDEVEDPLEESIIEHAIETQGFVTPLLTHYMKINPKTHKRGRRNMVGTFKGGALPQEETKAPTPAPEPEAEDIADMFFK